MHAGPIPRGSFDELLAHYKPYIKHVAFQHTKPHPYSSIEDIEQELAIVLWEVHEKYKDKPDDEFHKILATSIIMKIRMHFRAKTYARDSGMTRLDAQSNNLEQSNGRSSIANIAHSEHSEDFYRHGIHEILDKAPLHVRDTVMDAIDPSVKTPKRGRKPGRKALTEYLENA